MITDVLVAPSADRIPQFGGALPWRVSDWACPECGRIGDAADEVGMGRCPCGYDLEDADEFSRPPPTTRSVMDCPKCGGDGWLWGRELDNPPDTDTQTRYFCDRCDGRGHATWSPLCAGVALLCLLLTGCQVVAYQHNDYRNYSELPKGSSDDDDKRLDSFRPGDEPGVRDAQRSDDNPDVGPTFPGLFGISPGIEDLARLAGPDCWVANSAGAARAASLIRAGRPPRVLLLIDPWPVNIEIPDGPELVVVVTGRPGRVKVSPGTRLDVRTHAGGSCPWAWTIGHVYACRWPESVEAAIQSCTSCATAK